MEITNNIELMLKRVNGYLYLTNKTGIELIDNLIERVYLKYDGGHRTHRFIYSDNNKQSPFDIDITNRTCVDDYGVSYQDDCRDTKYYINVINNNNIKILLEEFDKDELIEIFNSVNRTVNTDKTPVGGIIIGKTLFYGSDEHYENINSWIFPTTLFLSLGAFIGAVADNNSGEYPLLPLAKISILVMIMLYLIYFIYINKNTFAIFNKIFSPFKYIKHYSLKLLVGGLIIFLLHTLFFR